VYIVAMQRKANSAKPAADFAHRVIVAPHRPIPASIRAALRHSARIILPSRKAAHKLT